MMWSIFNGSIKETDKLIACDDFFADFLNIEWSLHNVCGSKKKLHDLTGVTKI